MCTLLSIASNDERVSDSEGRIGADITTCSIVGRSEELAFQQFSMSFQVLSDIFGFSNRSGRFPFMTSQLMR